MGSSLLVVETQICVMLSQLEAEYGSVADCTKNVFLSRMPLKLLKSDLTAMRVRISIETEGMIELVLKPICTYRTKHINLRHRFSDIMSRSGQSNLSCSFSRAGS